MIRFQIFTKLVRLSEGVNIGTSIFRQPLELLTSCLSDARNRMVEDLSRGLSPRYTRLPHTEWHDKVTFQDMAQPTASLKDGYSKFRVSLLARLEKWPRFSYLLNDTCCIDKSSNTELSETINAIVRFHKRAFI